MPPEITQALIGLIGLLVGAVGTYLVTKRTNETNRAIALERLRAENQLSDAASESLRELLSGPEWELRSFDAIKKHLRGFEDNELRRLLVACGAVSFDQRGSGKDLWGLRLRNADKLTPAPGAPSLLASPTAGSRLAGWR